MSANSRTVVAAALAIVLVGIGAFSVGRLTAPVEATPSSASAAAGFARDMQVHHDQGVELAMLIRDRTDDEALRSLAYDITLTQANQSGQMLGWLNTWNLPQASPEPSMTWMSRPPLKGSMDHSSMASDMAASVMPGLATPEQMESLRQADGVEAERIFLTLMIAHHRGAIEMSEAVLERTDVSVVRAFAGSVVAAQSSEIAYMTELLAARS